MAQSTTKALKIVVIGGNGTIGKHVIKALKEIKDLNIEIVIGGRDNNQKGGVVAVDIKDTKSVANFFKNVKKIDHLVVVCGDAPFGPISKLTKEDFAQGFQSKAFGQIDVVLQAAKGDSMNDGGSITLTTGILDITAMPLTSGLAAANGCVTGFVRSAATEMPRGIRVNVVSPGLLVDSVSSYGSVLRGIRPVEGSDVANGYIRSMFGGITGKVLECFGPIPPVET